MQKVLRKLKLKFAIILHALYFFPKLISNVFTTTTTIKLKTTIKIKVRKIRDKKNVIINPCDKLIKS